MFGCDAVILFLLPDITQAQPVWLSPSHALWHKIDTISENNTDNKGKLGWSLDPSEWYKVKIHENFLCPWKSCVIEALGPSFLLQKCVLYHNENNKRCLTTTFPACQVTEKAS